MKKFLAKCLIFFGIVFLLLGCYFLWERNDPSRLSFSSSHIVYIAPSKTRSMPVQISISPVHIHIPVFPAAIHNNTWDTTTQGASYLLSSPVPGDTGNSIIYAHNWTSLFGNLVEVKPGEKVQIKYADTTIKTFTIAYTSVVSPSEIQILAPSHDARITLYTCTGFLDSQRFVAVATVDK